MDTAYPRTVKSTIGRTYNRSAQTLGLRTRGAVARHRPFLRKLAGVFRWARDPLGLGDGQADWSLDETEIRADLEHGRD